MDIGTNPKQITKLEINSPKVGTLTLVQIFLFCLVGLSLGILDLKEVDIKLLVAVFII